MIIRAAANRRQVSRLLAVMPCRGRHASKLRQQLPGKGWNILALSDHKNGVTNEEKRQTRPALVNWATQVLLPSNYPNSVTTNYLSYVQWTFLGLITGRLQSVLATQAALFAVGLGAGAIPMAAAVQWVLKDGLGHACAILYSTAVNTRFDADAKRYRFHATVAHTVADMISITLPLFPHYFLILASISSATHSMANMAHLASRARIQASFARQGNLADVARTGQTQSQLTNLLGTGIGATLSWFIGPNPLHVGACLVPLAAVSLYCMYQSSRVVVLTSFNVQRAECVFRAILHQIPLTTSCNVKACSLESSVLRAPTPHEVAEEETILLPRSEPLFQRGLLLQPLFSGAANHAPLLRIPPLLLPRRVEAAAALPLLHSGSCAQAMGSQWHGGWHADGAYALAWRSSTDISNAGSRVYSSAGTAPVLLWHCQGATNLSKLQAVWHACVLRDNLSKDGCEDVDRLHRYAEQWWPQVHQSLEASGWSFERVFLDGAGGCLELEAENQRE
mmetsp:Transcript_14143/g.27944  ORF Transcript_14143/g.27944 Transcript_14143/m.27944 type:complete len:507 (+) Transcript_14143:50-1570(+)